MNLVEEIKKLGLKARKPSIKNSARYAVYFSDKNGKEFFIEARDLALNNNASMMFNLIKAKYNESQR